jgi:hypothetical protein
VDEVVYGLTMTPCSGFSQPRQLGPKSLSDLRTSQPHRNHGARVTVPAIASEGKVGALRRLLWPAPISNQKSPQCNVVLSCVVRGFG